MHQVKESLDKLKDSLPFDVSDHEVWVTIIAGVLVAWVILGLLVKPRGGKLPPKLSSVIVPGSANGDSGDIHRHPEAPAQGLETTMPGKPDVLTCYDIFQYGLKINASGNCYGWRPKGADGKAGPYEWLTYQQVADRASAFGSGLVKLGLVPDVDGMKMLGLFMKNKMEWVLAEIGLFMQGGTTVPIYDTLGPDTLAFIIKQTSLKCIVLDPTEVGAALEAKDECPTLKALIQTGLVSEETRAAAAAKGITVHSFEDIVDAGKESPLEHKPPRPEQVATFCYTSGTTGNPKGVMLTHANFVACLAGANRCGLEMVKDDVHLSYLPLAHVLERLVQASMLSGGGCIGFYQGNTLKLMEDLKEIRPTVFPSVPRLLNKVYDKISAKFGSKPILKMLTSSALKSKVASLRSTGALTHPLWDTLLFNKVAAGVGLDRCKLIVTGSAPIHGEVLDFLRVVFKVNVVEGYGQSETAASGTLTHIDAVTSGHVGCPSPSIEAKLVSVPDMAYLVTDTVHNEGEEDETPCVGRGEICFRGPGVFKHYYKDEAKTKETIDSEGWCHTGDIGIWLTDGNLKIVDRKKNMFKLAQGEYVAAEKIENVYIALPELAQVFVYGDSLQSCLVAVVVPEWDELLKWTASNGIDSTDREELCKDKRVIAYMLKEMTKLGKERKLKGFELARALHLSAEPFSVENDLLTPTFKLKRHQAKLAFKDEIGSLYDAMPKR